MEERDWVQEALKNLRPDTPNWYGWAKTDSSGNRIPDDQRMCWEHAIVVQDGVTKPTQAEFDAEVKRLKDEYNADAYKRDRAKQYKPVTDQLDMLWHAIDTGTLDKTCDFYTVNKTVKDNNPKE
jgi:hypothetical protein